jgi:hypothetical protein
LPYISFVFPSSDAERTPVGARCCHSRVLRVRIMLYSGSFEGLYEHDVRKSKLEKLYAKVDCSPSNFRAATPKERLSVPAVAMAMFCVSVSCSTVDQLKVYMSAMFENRSSKNSTPSRRSTPYPPSNFRAATPKERLPVPVDAVGVFSGSVSCSTVGKFKGLVNAIFEKASSKKLYAK